MKASTVFLGLVAFVVLFQLPLYFMMNLQPDDPYATKIAKQQRSKETTQKKQPKSKKKAAATELLFKIDSRRWMTAPTSSSSPPLNLEIAPADPIPAARSGERDLSDLLNQQQEPSSNDHDQQQQQQRKKISASVGPRLVELLTEDDEAEIERSRWWQAPVPRSTVEYNVVGTSLSEFLSSSPSMIVVMFISGGKSLRVAETLLKSNHDGPTTATTLLLLVPPTLAHAAQQLSSRFPGRSLVWSVSNRNRNNNNNNNNEQGRNNIFGVNAWSMLPVIANQLSKQQQQQCILFLAPGIIDLEAGTAAAMASQCASSSSSSSSASSLIGCSPVSAATIESFDTMPDVASRWHFGQGLNAHLGTLGQVWLDERLSGASFRDRRARRSSSSKSRRRKPSTSSGEQQQENAVVVDDLEGTENLAAPSPFCFAATASSIIDNWPMGEKREAAMAKLNQQQQQTTTNHFAVPASFVSPPLFPASLLDAQEGKASCSSSLVFLPIHIDILSFLLNAAGSAFWSAPSAPAVSILGAQATFYGPAGWSPVSNNNNEGESTLGVASVTTDAGVLSPGLYGRVSVAALARLMHVAKLPASWWPSKVRQFALSASSGKIGKSRHDAGGGGGEHEHNNNNKEEEEKQDKDEKQQQQKQEGFFSRLFHGAAKLRFSHPDAEKAEQMAAAPRPALIWDGFCIPCFGWSQEEQGYAVGLEGHLPLRLMQGPECFCPGTPRWVRRSLARLATKKFFQVPSPDQPARKEEDHHGHDQDEDDDDDEQQSHHEAAGEALDQQQQPKFHAVSHRGSRSLAAGSNSNSEQLKKKRNQNNNMKKKKKKLHHDEEFFIIVVIHKDPGSMPSSIGNGAIFGLHRRPDAVIARSMFEFTAVPKPWALPKYVTECWVPSRFVRYVFSRVGEKRFPVHKLVVVPEPVDAFYYDPVTIEPLEMPPSLMQNWKRDSTRVRPTTTRSSNSNSNDDKIRSTLAGNMKFFSAGKWEARKGLDLLVEAFVREFAPDERVSLYISSYLYGDDTRDPAKLMRFVRDIAERVEKEGGEQEQQQQQQRSHNGRPLFSGNFPGAKRGGGGKLSRGKSSGNNFAPWQQRHQQRIEERRESNSDGGWKSRVPHIEIITERLPESELLALYRSVDAFVLPTRGEGWGLPTIQAMSMGLPVISTNWSGSVDFTTPETSFLIPIDGVEPVESGAANEGKDWALPSLPELRKLLRHVFTYPNEGKAKGAKARAYVAEQYSQEGIAELVVERAEVLRNRAVFGSDSGPVWLDSKQQEEKQHVHELFEEAGHLFG